MITVDHERGVYTYEGHGVKEEYPHITRILSPVMDHRATDYALNRGRLVHQACAILDSGKGGGLHWDSLDPELRPRVEAWANFKQHMGLEEFSLIEQPIISFKERYGGTPDRFTNRRTWWTVPVILEIKNGDVIGWEGLQLAGQMGLIQAQTHISITGFKRKSVHLFPNGTWKLEHWDDPSDWKVFLALLEVQNWRIRNARV